MKEILVLILGFTVLHKVNSTHKDLLLIIFYRLLSQALFEHFLVFVSLFIAE